MTAADLAAIYHVSIRTIRRWAADDRWQRKPGRPVLYSTSDASRSYHRRHPGHGRPRLPAT
jgi:uncharacterized protein YjcR